MAFKLPLVEQLGSGPLRSQLAAPKPANCGGRVPRKPRLDELDEDRQQ